MKEIHESIHKPTQIKMWQQQVAQKFESTYLRNMEEWKKLPYINNETRYIYINYI